MILSLYLELVSPHQELVLCLIVSSLTQERLEHTEDSPTESYEDV